MAVLTFSKTQKTVEDPLGGPDEDVWEVVPSVDGAALPRETYTFDLVMTDTQIEAVVLADLQKKGLMP